MYLITDSYGTRQVAWRWSTALEWLACTACKGGTIRNRFTLAVIARRHQEN